MTEILEKDCIVYTLYIKLFTLYLFLLKRYVHGIYAAGRGNVLTQQKKSICA